jgi:hypothetical protein
MYFKSLKQMTAYELIITKYIHVQHNSKNKSIYLYARLFNQKPMTA